MADLKFVDQHNMVACLEKTEENAEFHQIVDFLSTCLINYALTVSPTIYASYIEQFWNTATSKTVNSVKQIHAIVDGKAVVISESSVRSDLLFNDEDGISCLTDDEIFENLALMGYEQLSIKLTFDKGNGNRWQSRRQRNKGLLLAQTRSERELRKAPMNHPPRMSHIMEVGRAAWNIHFWNYFDKEMKRKLRKKEIAITYVEDSPKPIRSITTLQPLPTIDPKDKGKGVLVEEEPEKVKRRDQGALLAKSYDEIQARIDVDHELVKKETIGSRKSRVNKEQTTDKNSKQMKFQNYKNSVICLENIDRQDVIDLHRKMKKEESTGTTIDKTGYCLTHWVSNSLVHSIRALSTLRRSSLRMASTAAKPCQGDSSEFYESRRFRNSDACYHDPEKCEHASLKVTTSHGGNTTIRMIWRFTMADDLKECSKITQVK
ncbi:hypothetical protein Tco_0506309 [Tanacetum coccineum]